MAVAPVTAAGNPAPATIWVPPGRWLDYFTGRRFVGPATETLSVPFSQMPVLVRAGSILPTQPNAPYTAPGPNPRLVLTAFPGGDGRFSLYDDQGLGFGYQRGAFTRTDIIHTERRGVSTLTIEPAHGSFRGELARRAWTIEFTGIARPTKVTVDGRAARFSYVGGSGTLTVQTGFRSTHSPVTVVATG